MKAKVKDRINFEILRSNIGLTRKSLSEKADISVRTIDRLERGNNISLISAFKICQGCNFDFDDIFDKVETRSK